MAENMIDLNGLVHVWSKVKTLTDNCVKASDLATVATSGSYNDLSDKPTIPSAYTLPTASNTVMGGVKIGSNISVSSGTISITKSNVTSALGYTPPTSDTTYVNATASAAGLMSSSDKSKLDSIAANANNYIHPASHPVSMITGLAAVATSGSYSDLSNKPTIPVVPTNVSAFINDAGYLTQHQSLDDYAKKTDVNTALADKLGINDTAAAAIKDGAGNTISTTYTSKADVSALLSTKLGVTSIAYAATRDGVGNIIVDTYAKKTDISGMVKTVNGTAPDSAGNVTINVSGGGSSVTVDTELSSTSTNPVQNKVINAALNRKADSSMLSDYLPLAGGVCTGGVSAPNFRTGTGATNYFQCQKFRGEGDANAYYHAVDFGYSGHDSVDFYEYDPNWNFYKCTTGTKSGAVLVGNINRNGWNGGAVLSGTPTAPTATVGTNTTQIATTAFVQTAVGSKVDASLLATVATSGSYNDLTDKPVIPGAYTLPNATSSTLGGVKIGNNISVTNGTISLSQTDVTSALGYTPPASDTTYGNATTTSSGLMSSTDKVKLNGIANNANYYIHPPTHPASMISGLATVATSGSYNDLTNKPTIPEQITVDSEISSTSTNPVQNKIVYEVLSAVRENLLTQINNLSAVAKSGSYNDLTDKPSNATTSSAGLMSAADKSKLDGISSDSGNVKMIVYS